MKTKAHRVIFALFTILSIISFSSCLVEIELSATKTIAPTNTPTLRAAATYTPSPIPTETPTVTPTSTATPTPAPVTWTIEKGNELMAIALYYGISLEDLLAANPSVTPNWLSVGTILEIPVTPSPIPTNTPTLTATIPPTATSTSESMAETSSTPSGPLQLASAPTCYPNLMGELRCISLIQNIGKELLENPSVIFRLNGPEGETLSEIVAYAPLNLLPAGESLPVLASFPGPIPEEFEVTAEIEYFLPTMPDDNRYAETKISKQQINISGDHKLAIAEGEIELLMPDRDIESLSILAVAYDKDDRAIGFRRFEASIPLSTAKPLPFRTIVYALGGEILRVELTAEARYENQ
jgi:LysM repeat protein